jgi:hypothetical protein
MRPGVQSPILSKGRKEEKKGRKEGRKKGRMDG